jgi:hypothetical protein
VSSMIMLLSLRCQYGRQKRSTDNYFFHNWVFRFVPQR